MTDERSEGLRPLPIINPDRPPAPAGPPPRGSDREAASRHPSQAPAMPGVGNVVAVSSGKGGVGKSTVSTNLAATWATRGHRVGLLDADIYGPDIPTMFGILEKPRIDNEEVVPLEAHGVKLMSIGFLIDEDAPAIWRGPIIMGVIRQFLQQVAWGELDYLVIDLPPGTGDAQLSLCQLVRVDGAVMVTTPQDVAVGGVLRGIRMFEKIEVPVLGVVENMRGFACPSCGETHDIFGSGGGERLAGSLDAPFLGAIPLGMAVREEGDRGVPTSIGRPDSAEATAFGQVATAAAGRLEEVREPVES
ncbi:MAG: Mrp/NBP35 family ATP-binding protein [Gemmatimonadetes bacterium]|nr:Mrp/NBP35 family ATP-binding protein [Gemmatimonadota bacterium]